MPWSSGASVAKRPHLESGTKTYPGGKMSAGGSVSASSVDTKKKGPWHSALLMCHSPWPPYHPNLQFFKLVCFPIFWINEETLLLMGLCLIWFRVTIFSLDHTLLCSITSGSST